MLETPRITQTTDQLTALIHLLTVPREEMRNVMGPGIAEVRAALASQGVTATGPWFTHHLKMDPGVFDFEICVPVATPVAASGRVEPGRLPAGRVVRTVYVGAYEGLPDAWGELMAWIAANGHTTRPDLWECYAVGPETTPDPASWRTELNRPLC